MRLFGTVVVFGALTLLPLATGTAGAAVSEAGSVSVFRKARSVRCCLDVELDGGAARPLCMVLNVRTRPRRLLVRARTACRLLGGRVQRVQAGGRS
jgi:hypothetical protein